MSTPPTKAAIRARVSSALLWMGEAVGLKSPFRSGFDDYLGLDDWPGGNPRTCCVGPLVGVVYRSAVPGAAISGNPARAAMTSARPLIPIGTAGKNVSRPKSLMRRPPGGLGRSGRHGSWSQGA